VRGTQTWLSRLDRVRRMSLHEIGTRSTQAIYKRWDLARYRLGAFPRVNELPAGPRTTGRFFFSPTDVPEILELWGRMAPDEVARTIRTAENICAHRFDLLGYEGLDYGPSIDWSLDRVHEKRAPHRPWFKIDFLDFNEVGDVKVTWELSRHQHLVTLAKAFRLTGQERFLNEALRQWYDWQKNNPYPMGVNWASTLEVAFRSLSWLWLYHIGADTSIVPASFNDDLWRALAHNGRYIERYLSTYFAPNTHLLGEAVALFFIGILCPDLASARRWRTIGWDITLEQARRQVRADGMHFEQSTYYHVYALDFFLHARILASRNDVSIPQSFDRTLEKMLDVLQAMGAGGSIARLGDDDGGRVFDHRRNRAEHLLDPLATGSVLFQHPDFKAAASGIREETLWLLGPGALTSFESIAATSPPRKSAALEASGIHVLASPEDRDFRMTIDAGPLGTGTGGHGHADALSVQVAFNGREWLSDPGTGTYIDDTGDRNRFRVTQAHNTLEVDGRSQAEPAGPFSWRELPVVQVERCIAGETFDLFVASHTGYLRLEPSVVHRRWVFNLKTRFCFIFDEASGAGTHELCCHWHFAPGLQLHFEEDAAVATLSDGERFAVHVSNRRDWSRAIIDGCHSPAYGRKQSCSILRFTCRADLPTGLGTLLQPNPQPLAGTGVFTEIRGAAHGGVAAFRYDTGGSSHLFFLSREKPWQIGRWSSDAEFVYCSVSEGVERYELILCNGTFVAAAGEDLLRFSAAVSRCEIEVASDGKRVFHSGASMPDIRLPGSIASVSRNS
jgi:hypothetical protein